MTSYPHAFPRWSLGPLSYLRRADGAAFVLAFVAANLVLAVGCGRTGEDQPVNAACDAPATTRKAPFAVTFRFRDDGDRPVFLHEGCGLPDYGISSCPAGFRDQLGPVFTCGICECDATACQPSACGQCAPEQSVTVAPGAVASFTWDGVGRAINARAQGQCVRSRTLPAGTYRVAIRVFDNVADAERNVGGWLVARGFVLPAGGGVVAGPIGPGPCDSFPRDRAGP